MKIVCDSCSTKYSISDDKVRGKVFKIRCKKCSHIIVVKGTTEAAPSVVEAPSDALWHLVVDGDQVGPLTDADVRARLSRNEISTENYVWKEGFADWLRLAEVPEFADPASSASVTAGELFPDSGRADANEVVERAGELGGFFAQVGVAQEVRHAASSAEPSAGLGGVGGGAAAGGIGSGIGSGWSARSRAPSGEQSPSNEDAFAIPGAGSPAPVADGADLFGVVAPVAARAESGRLRAHGTNGAALLAGRHDGGRVENLTAQRSENSVLFSLSNLQSLASPAPVSKPGTVQSTEGSGLIDIRAMAASTLRAPGAGGLPAFGDARSADNDLPAFGAFSSAAPVLLPIPSSSGPPKWVWALLGLGVLVLAAVVGLAVNIWSKPAVTEQLALAPVAPPSERAAPRAVAEAPAAATAPIAAADLPPRDNGTTGDKPGPGVAAGSGAEKAGEKFGKGGRKFRGFKKTALGGESRASGASGSVASGSSAPAADPEKAKPAKGSLDDLLEGALNGRKSRPKVDDDSPSGKRSTEAASGGPLAKAAVVAGMNSVKGKVAACYGQFKVPGLAMVNVVIGKNGRISSAAVTGKFAGTPTGACVESAVKTASFPPSEGLSTPYPFSLR